MAKEDFDGVAKATSGVVDAGTAATVTSYGGMLPGAVGLVSDSASVALGTVADETDILEGADAIARRLAMNLEELRSKSSSLRDDEEEYRNGTKYAKRYGGLGAKLGGAAAGAAVGAAMLSPIPFGSVVGGLGGGIVGGYSGGQAGSFIFPEKPVTNTAINNQLIAMQDAVDPELTPEEKEKILTTTAQQVMLVMGRRASPNDQAYIEEQVKLKNVSGLGMDGIAEQHFSPLLGDDFDAGNSGETAVEYLARKIVAKEIDAGQLFLDTGYMQAVPPNPERVASSVQEIVPELRGGDGAYGGAGSSLPMKARKRGPSLN